VEKEGDGTSQESEEGSKMPCIQNEIKIAVKCLKLQMKIKSGRFREKKEEELRKREGRNKLVPFTCAAAPRLP
jgi:hypothetical protein